MVFRIYRQNDGKYAVYSSVVDAFHYVDGTKEEAREYLKQEYGFSDDRLDEMIERADAGEWPHHACPDSYERARERDRKNSVTE